MGAHFFFALTQLFLFQQVHGTIVIDLENKPHVELRCSPSAVNGISVVRSLNTHAKANDAQNQTRLIEVEPGESLRLKVGDVLEIGEL